jgi:hypothetical protein
MVAVETVLQIRILNMSPKEIKDEDTMVEAYKRCNDRSAEISNDISDMIFNKYCNPDTDAITTEVMKVQPLTREDVMENYEVIL